MRDRLNLVLKRRVWYQPFCPSMLESEAPRLLADWTGGAQPRDDDGLRGGPERTAPAGRRHQRRRHLPAADSLPTTNRGAFAALLREARRRWGSRASVLNTSFNIHGEPLVCTPDEAIDVFRRSGADALAIGPFLVERPA